MAVARAKRQARGRQPKLSPKQQAELCRMYASSDYASANLAELFTVSQPTMYRTLQRSQAPRHGDAMPAPRPDKPYPPVFGEYFGNPWCPARMTMHTNADSC
jgi:hypothetical protein